MTRSRVSPDGKIASRDVAAKLVIVMVGLPARGKSYITKKLQRYLAWQQHNCRIFNVGNRRRVAAGAPPVEPASSDHLDSPTQAATILLNGVPTQTLSEPTSLNLDHPSRDEETLMETSAEQIPTMDQSATFFDPLNEIGARIRDQVALETLDELLDYLLLQDGSVGIFDATNSTVERRKLIVSRIKEREPKIGILFIESICRDPDVSLRFRVIQSLSTSNIREKTGECTDNECLIN
jgi:6-phosphofructo-2-kinase